MRKNFIGITVLLFIIVVFFDWLNPLRTLSSGDWPFFYQNASQSFSLAPTYYKAHWGLGETKVIFTTLESYFQWSAKIMSPLVPWEISEKLFWFFPFLLVSFFSAKTFSKSLLGSLIFTTNTYILMVVSGGQMGVALSYAFVPMVIHMWTDLVDTNDVSRSKRFYKAGIVGFFLALQVFFDPRIALLTVGIASLYHLYDIFFVREKINQFFKRVFFSLFFPLIVTLCLHSVWVLPMLLYGVGPSDHDDPSNYSQGALDFFSFSDFSHMLSLLHPNWPENIFGKVYFLQPEFLILPLFVFTVLLLLQKKGSVFVQSDKKKILFFLFIGLLGAFLSKGVNEPFGSIYGWLYSYVPGFLVFRDPTKFMLLIALSYAYILPKVPVVISERISSTLQKRRIKASSFQIQQITFLLFICAWGLLIRQAVLGDINGTLRSRVVPESYRSLTTFLTKDSSFFRVLWVPTHQRFGYYGNDHPAISATEFFNTSDTKKMLKMLNNQKTLSLLSESAVKYVVVPYDSQGEIFLSDRKYDEKTFTSLRREIQRIRLKRVASFDDMDVYEIPSSKDHIWIDSNKLAPKSSVTWRRLSPTHYSVSVDGHKGDTVVFSERFSRFWRLKEKEMTKTITPYRKILIGHRLEKDGRVEFEFYHVFENIITYSTALSIISLGVVATSLIILRKRVK